MKHQVLYALTAIGLSTSAAAADPMRMVQAVPHMLPPHEIASIVRSSGFKPMSPAMLRGDTYVLRAAGPDGREVRIVIMARSGDIVSASPVVAAAPSGERLGAYERMDSGPGYIAPPPAPIYHENDRPMRRPLASVPNAPSRSARVAPEVQSGPLYSEPPVVMRDDRAMRNDRGIREEREERGEHGLLPPPPDRFPPRAAPVTPAPKPAAKPAPVKRAAAPPLPKQKPMEANAAVAEDGAPPASAPQATTPAPAAAPPTAPAAPAPTEKVDSRSLPH